MNYEIDSISTMETNVLFQFLSELSDVNDPRFSAVREAAMIEALSRVTEEINY